MFNRINISPTSRPTVHPEKIHLPKKAPSSEQYAFIYPPPNLEAIIFLLLQIKDIILGFKNFLCLIHLFPNVINP